MEEKLPGRIVIGEFAESPVPFALFFLTSPSFRAEMVFTWRIFRDI